MRTLWRPAVILVAAGLMLAGGLGAPSASSAPASIEDPQRTVRPTPSPEPTSSASPTPLPVGRLASDGIAQVVTDNLVVRSLPQISDSSEIHPVRLFEPKLLFVLDGPVAADGYDWYLVAPFEEFVSDVATDEPRIGWVAAQSATVSRLVSAAPLTILARAALCNSGTM